MLRPKDLAPTDYTVALKPTFGYEQQLYVSTQASVELGMLEVTAPNSGVYTASVADNAALAGAPLEVLAEVEGDGHGCVVQSVDGHGDLQGARVFQLHRTGLPERLRGGSHDGERRPIQNGGRANSGERGERGRREDRPLWGAAAKHLPQDRLQDATELRPQGAVAPLGPVRAGPLRVRQAGRNP